MAIATVQGLLSYNTDIRNKHILRNIGKYSQYSEQLLYGVGEEANIDTNQLSSLTNGKSLLNYTHFSKNNLSKIVNNKYFFNPTDKHVYNVGLTPKPQLLYPWYDKGQNYVQYVDEIFGNDIVMKHINTINDFLAGQFIENALRKNEVAVVRDYQVNAAMAGAITTNIFNFSGMDTKLGLITNKMYSNALYQGSIFNSERMGVPLHIDDYTIPKTYLTPSLFNQYGNNSSTIYRLAEILRLNQGEIRIREDLGGNVKFNDISNNGGFDFLMKTYNDSVKYKQERNFTNTIYGPFKNRKYITFDKKRSDYRGIITTDFGYDDISIDLSKLSNIPVYGMYDENIGYNYNSNSNIESYTGINDKNNKSLISKTSNMFKQHKIDTMIGRFYDSKQKVSFIDTAISDEFGKSKGRNLLKLDVKRVNPSDNPYCRTWNFRHQYLQLKNLIRPFIKEDDDNNVKPYTIEEIQKSVKNIRAKDNNIDGIDIISNNTVLQDNGFVRITPQTGDDEKKGIEHCMFSIENLAWMDVYKDPKQRNISKEQIGPNGGRIMWFPPYDLDFQESVDVDWNENTFIGRGEKVYTYKNTVRNGTLSFSLLIDHPSIVDRFVNNSKDGMGEEKDPHADILRFFAGCNILEGDDIKNGEEIIQGPSDENENESSSINIKIYFPNNFSGLQTNKDLRDTYGFTNFSNYDLGGSPENDWWWRYILVGNNTIIPNNYDWFSGYEMNVNESQNSSGNTSGDTTGNTISKRTLTETNEKNSDAIKSRFIPVCKNYKKIVGTNNANCEEDENLLYHYHVDDDLRQILKDEESYLDVESYGLNVKLENEDLENCFTFAELMVCIMTIEKNPLLNEYSKYIYKQNSNSKSKVEKLIKIFNNKNIKYTSIEMDVDIDNNDPSNASMLAKRRKKIVKDLLKNKLLKGVENLEELFNGLNDTEISSDDSKNNTKEFENESPSNIDRKKSRCVSLTINYDKPKSENYSNAEQPVQDTNSQESEYITYEEFKKVLIDYSDIIKIYSDTYSYPLDDILKKVYKENTYTKKEWIDSNGGTINYKQINDIIIKIVDENKYDYIELAHSMSVSPCCDDFVKEVENEIGSKLNSSESTGLTYTPEINSIDDINYYLTLNNNSKEIINFMYANNKNISFSKGKKNYNVFGKKYPFNPRIVNYTDDGVENEKGCDNPKLTKIDFNKQYTHLLFVNYLNKYLNNNSSGSTSNESDAYNYYCYYYIIDLNKLDTIENYLVNAYDIIKKIIKLYNNQNNNYTEIKENRDEFNGIIKKINKIIDDDIIPKVNSAIEELKNNDSNEKTNIKEDVDQKNKNTNKNNTQQTNLNQTNKVAVGVIEPEFLRYETEAEYFNKLEVTDPILFKNLKEKFKYFNPAFHSITPEGFNARLTFLHQCTRQGATIESRPKQDGNDGLNTLNGGTRTASNLAFGRMPVCILRIGDFIYTKIIIKSISINYGSNGVMQWDLNPEGVGVQPMYAKVSMQIAIIGGQSLGAPINRLQNAVSFNYYANAGVYDNRADYAIYTDGGIQYKHVFTPIEEGTDDSKNIGK